MKSVFYLSDIYNFVCINIGIFFYFCPIFNVLKGNKEYIIIFFKFPLSI